MINTVKILILLCCVSVAFSCKKNEGASVTKGVYVKVDGIVMQDTTVLAYRYRYPIVAIDMVIGNKLVSVVFPAFRVGELPVPKKNSQYIGYSPDTSNDENFYSATSGRINIIKLTEHEIEGAFYGHCVNLRYPSLQKELTQGVFKVKIIDR